MATAGTRVRDSRLAALDFLEAMYLLREDDEQIRARVIELTGVPDENATTELCNIIGGLVQMARDSLDPAWSDDSLRQAIAARRGA